MKKDQELINASRFLRLKDREIQRQIELKKIAISQRNWMLLICIITTVLTLVLWLK